MPWSMACRCTSLCCGGAAFLDSPFARDPQKINLDKDDIRAVEALWARIVEYANPDYPFM